MNRYLTTEPMDNAGFNDATIAVFTEQDDWKAAIENAHCWVWQFADSPEQAIEQHIAKHEEWERDVDAGRPEKETY